MRDAWGVEVPQLGLGGRFKIVGRKDENEEKDYEYELNQQINLKLIKFLILPILNTTGIILINYKMFCIIQVYKTWP